MAKKINSTVELGGRKFREGDEAELTEMAELMEVDLTGLVEQGDLEGDWRSTKKAADGRMAREQAEAERRERVARALGNEE